MSFYSYLRKKIYPHKIIFENIPMNANILDIGCGRGTILNDKILSKINLYTGIDPKIKKKIIKKKIKIYNNSVRNILNEVGNYDCIIMIDVMHHILKSEQELIIKQIIHSMKKDCIFIYKDISNRSLFYSFMNAVHDLLYNFEFIKYLDSNIIINLLKKNNNYSYNHFYKRILWFDHEFIIIKKIN